MKNDVTILLTTCDKYYDALDPFFTFWKKQWSDCPYPFVINTETKAYSNPDFNIRNVTGDKDKPWSARLKSCLKTIDSEFVLLCLEDYFLVSPVKVEIFDRALNCMKNNPDVGVIQFAIDIYTRYDKEDVIDDYFCNVPKNKKGDRIFCVLSLYRREYLIKLLLNRESPWEYEIYGSYRSEYYKERVLRENNNHERCFEYYIEPKFGYAIQKGKWLPKNRELFERYDIKVDFSNLGIMSDDEWKKLYQVKTHREHRSKKELFLLLFKNPKEFFSIFKTVAVRLLRSKFPFV